MIITKTPFRMSFFGGGTDIPAFFKKHAGAVLSTTFDKYCYVSARHLPRFFDYSTEVVYSRIERVSDTGEVEHPAVRNAMRMLNMRELRLTYEADLPARSGLGTSSSFAVGMLHAFHALKGQFASKEQLAREAITLERDLCAEAGGWQDQVAAAYGGLNRIDFADGGFDVRPVIIPAERKSRLDERLMLFFTGFTRLSSEVQKIASRTADEGAMLEALALVDSAERILVDKGTELSSFGKLLHEGWMLKRSAGSGVSTPEVDEYYERARSAGALGGKLLGAGGGGFLLFFVEPEQQDAVRAALSDLLYVPFSFEEGGSRVLYYSPEPYDLTSEL